jgi:BirA family transcriptional regulator, biotin operon repressor / biotin---[acetyl-CoA-carboxylase] ligase
MATPYLQIFTSDVPSTQDLAVAKLESLPVAVIAPGQSDGRGRSGSRWENADRALAVSVAWPADDEDRRPFSLMAGIAAIRALDGGPGLKWPNDVMREEKKIGGILIERSDKAVVAGLGLNLFWVEPPEGVGSAFDQDPGAKAHRELGALWVAELMAQVETGGWPADEYREACNTLGRSITWEPNGEGIAAGISESGALLVDTMAGIEEIHAGAVRHVRHPD